jgi:hypothetical protein
MAKYKKPRRADDPLKMVLRELKYALAQAEIEAGRNNGKNASTKDYPAGYIDGLKHTQSVSPILKSVLDKTRLTSTIREKGQNERTNDPSKNH